jgi:hypothetical protein
MKNRLSEIFESYKGEFPELFTEIGEYNFGTELGKAKVFYSKKYKIFKVRRWFNTYYKSDFGIPVKNAKDEFYNSDGQKIGHSLTGALVDKYAIKFIKKYGIKPDFDKFLQNKSVLDRVYLEKDKDRIMPILKKELFSTVKSLFVSMISNKSKKAKEKLKKMRFTNN